MSYVFCCFFFHAPDWELGFDSAVDVFEGVEDETVECVVYAFERVVSFCEELVQSGFWRRWSPSKWYCLFDQVH